MDKIFGAKGILAKHLGSYEPRPGQLEMARIVEALLAETDNSLLSGVAGCEVIEAETGLGKTLAYLVPAALSGRKVVISTNTKNLQDQILTKDIPFIRNYILPDLKAVCVKGRENYLCLHRYHQAIAGRRDELFSNEQMDGIDDWLHHTVWGDGSELEFLRASSPLWQKICCQSHSCQGQECFHYNDCFLTRLRKEAAASRLLIVNHHLLFSDLAVRKGGYGEVLPRYEAIIFDEAHHLEQVATTFFGVSFSRYQVKELATDLEHDAMALLGGELRDGVLAGSHTLAGVIEEFAAFFPTEKGRFPLSDIFSTQVELIKCKDRLAAGLRTLSRRLDEACSQTGPWEGYLNRCDELASRLETVSTVFYDDLPEDEITYVHWFERTERNLTLAASPIDIASHIRETLLTTVGGCIFTSATLRTGESFSYYLESLGLPEETGTHFFPSPFNYEGQTLIHLPPKTSPVPSAPGHTKWLHDMIVELVGYSGGRALVLFTSIQAMHGTYYGLRDRIKFPIYMQGSMSRRQLLEHFKRDIDSILFGVSSFWEGVDVAGESLSLVIIDKIPFEVPTDPVIIAKINRIKNRGGNPFFDFQVPRAILTLRQGVGRLMRTGSDHGVIALLDARLVTKGYGRHFIKSLPPSPKSSDLEEVRNFFLKQNDVSK
ncbi:MAG: ATP-dependent DNA helicase [Desulfobulbaceae bacterium]|nr:ATP-dependent DNA helicase [Desulfobulbaceae bacterium]